MALGTKAPAALQNTWDTSIPPDGTGLPAGSGGSGQGKALFEAQCRHCHGVAGRGGPAGALAGGSLEGPAIKRTIGSYWPYATTVFDYVRRAMPYEQPGSLADDEVYALAAYLLAENGIIEAGSLLDAVTLPKVVMPNRGGFPAPEN
jgi:cytochrome c